MCAVTVALLSAQVVACTLRSPEGLVFDDAGNLWVGYFTGNELVRFTPAELAVSHPKAEQFVPNPFIKLPVTALVTDLAIDQAGNLWTPGALIPENLPSEPGTGTVYRIDRAQLSAATPTVVQLRSGQIGSAEKLALHSVSGDLFIAP